MKYCFMDAEVTPAISGPRGSSWAGMKWPAGDRTIKRLALREFRKYVGTRKVRKMAIRCCGEDVS